MQTSTVEFLFYLNVYFEIKQFEKVHVLVLSINEFLNILLAARGFFEKVSNESMYLSK